MNAINQLKRDHTIFRSKLTVLESALHMGQDAWFVLRAECFSLAKQLEGHLRREEGLSASCHAVPSHGQPSVALAGHAAEHRQLAFINRFFLEQPSRLLKRIKPTVTLLVSVMRGRMDRQELTDFPMAEETLVRSQVNQLLTDRLPKEERPPGILSETMTVGEVLARHPAAGSVLDRLFIDQRFERYDCLDEVAWRHGMKAQDLVTALEEAVERSAAPSGDGQAAVGVLARSGE